MACVPFEEEAFMIKIPGQGTDMLAAMFRHHYTAFVNGKYYDPSYGEIYADLDKIEEALVDGYYLKVKSFLHNGNTINGFLFNMKTQKGLKDRKFDYEL